jgi:hypothetical protein
MGEGEMTAYKDWEQKWKKELDFFMNTTQGKEIQLNLMAQGYEEILFEKLTILFASGFIAVDIIKDLREQIK